MNIDFRTVVLDRPVRLAEHVLGQMDGHVDGRTTLALGMPHLQPAQTDLAHLATVLDSLLEAGVLFHPCPKRGLMHAEIGRDFLLGAAQLGQLGDLIDVDLASRAPGFPRARHRECAVELGLRKRRLARRGSGLLLLGIKLDVVAWHYCTKETAAAFLPLPLVAATSS
jgi:hypothetical protein